jgi:hypothetical protein
MASPFLPGMRAEIKALILEWGKSTKISRFSASVATGGRLSGSFVSGATELIWIQPVGGFSDVKEADLDEETTHLCFQYWSGYNMRAKDRLLPSGETLEYDVIRSHLKESHQFSELKQVRRS